MTNRKVLDLDELFAAPQGEVSTSQGPVFLYSLNAETLKDYEGRATLTPDERGDWLLRRMTSQVRRERLSQDVQPLPPEILSDLTDGDVAAIGEVLRTKSLSDQNVKEKPAFHADPRKVEESGRAFLARVVDAGIAAEMAKSKETWANAMGNLGSMGKMFGNLQASSGRLGDTLRSLDSLNQRPPSDRLITTQHDHFQRMAVEHSEDRERARLTSQATAESAEMLQQLVRTAQQFMVDVAARDLKADRQIRLQLGITVVSVVAGLIVSIFAAWYAVRSYEHDVAKDAVDDGTARAAAAREERAIKALEQSTKLLEQNSTLIEEINALRSAARPATIAPADPRKP